MPVFPNSHWLKSRHFTSKRYTATGEINPLAPRTAACPEQIALSVTISSCPITILLALKFQVFAFKHKTGLDIHSLLSAHTGTLAS